MNQSSDAAGFFSFVWKIRFFLLFLLTDFLVRFHFRKREKKELGILLLRTDALGDFLLTLPVMKQIHDVAVSRGLSVTAVVSESIQELACRCPFFDSVIVIPGRERMRNFSFRIEVWREFAAARAHTVINMLSFSRSAIEDYIAYFTEAAQKQKAALDMGTFPLVPATTFFREVMNFTYGKNVDYVPGKTLLENEARLTSIALGAEIHPELGDIDFLRPFPDSQCGQPYYLVVPGAADRNRRWPPEKFAAVIDAVAEFCPDLVPVVSGLQSDDDSAQEILRHVKHPERLLNLCGRSSLMQLFGNVDGAAFILTNDTGTYHIAAKLRKTTFCIFGLGHAGVYAPNPCYSSVVCIGGTCDTPCCNWICRRPPDSGRRFSCVRDIPVDEVIRAIQAFLTRNTRTA